MTPPILITPPRDAIVPLADLRAHLRVDSDAEDALISSLADAAAAWLDGWTGVLGRAVMPQVWREEFEAPGPHVLALPDATVTAATVNGEPVAVTQRATAAGVEVKAAGVAGTVTVTYSCALPAHRLPAAQAAIKMLVAHWYQTREAVAAGAMAPVPMGAEALIGTLRWRRL